jgi:hypothetical protein
MFRRKSSRRSTKDASLDSAMSPAGLNAAGSVNIDTRPSIAREEDAAADRDSSSKDMDLDLDMDSSEMDDEDLQEYLNSLVETRISDNLDSANPSTGEQEEDDEQEEEDRSVRMSQVRRRLSTRVSPSTLGPSTSSEPSEASIPATQEVKPFVPSAGMMLLQEFSTQLLENPERYTTKDLANAEARLKRTMERQEKEQQRAAAAIAAADAAATAAAEARAQADAAADAYSVRPSQVKRAVAEAAEARAQVAADAADAAQARAEAAAEVRLTRPSEIKAQEQAKRDVAEEKAPVQKPKEERAEETTPFAAAKEAVETVTAASAAAKMQERATRVAEPRSVRPSEIKAQAGAKRPVVQPPDEKVEPARAAQTQEDVLAEEAKAFAAAQEIIADAERRMRRRTKDLEVATRKAADAAVVPSEGASSDAKHGLVQASRSDTAMQPNIPLPDMLLGLAAKVLCGFCMCTDER